MLNLIKQMKADLEKLEGLVNALPEKPRSLIRKVDRKAKAGDYVKFPNIDVAGTDPDLLYKVSVTKLKEVPIYADSEGNKCLVYGWLHNEPVVYEVVVNEDA